MSWCYLWYDNMHNDELRHVKKDNFTRTTEYLCLQPVVILIAFLVQVQSKQVLYHLITTYVYTHIHTWLPLTEPWELYTHLLSMLGGGGIPVEQKYRPANKKTPILFGVSLAFLFVGPNPGQHLLSDIRFLIHRTKVSNRALFARILRVFSCWRRLFWKKGAPCFDCAEVRGAGSRNEDCRQQPPAADYT